MSFAHFGFDEQLLAIIQKSEFTQPTPIQAQAIPVALSGRDVIGIAKTGSGKTAAFLWPLLVHAMDQPELKEGEGPIGLICAPTRELCQQVRETTGFFGRSVCPSVCLSPCPSVSLSLYQSLCLFVLPLFVLPSIFCLSLYLFVPLSISPSICPLSLSVRTSPSIRPLSPSVCTFVCLSIHLSYVCLSVHPFFCLLDLS